MTIKSKLITNVLVTAAIVVALSMASFYSMSMLREKLVYLTEKSTPFQIRTMELQRELQGAVSALFEVTAAQDMTVYRTLRAAAEKKLALVSATRQQLVNEHGSSVGFTDEFDKLARELFDAVQERIASSNAAAEANSRVSRRMQVSSARLKELDDAIRTLQADRSAAFATALSTTEQITANLRNLEALRDMFKDLQQLTQGLQSPQTASTLLLAKARLNTLASRIMKNDHYKIDRVFSTQARELFDKLSEQIRLLSAASRNGDEAAKERAVELLKGLSSTTNVLFLEIDQEAELASSKLRSETGRQREIFSQANSANSVLVENAALVATGLQLTADVNRLFTLGSVPELDRSEQALQNHFNRIQQQRAGLEQKLVALKAGNEVKALQAAVTALMTTRSEVTGNTGILAALRAKLKAEELAGQTVAKLHAMVARQTARGSEAVSAARHEQDTAVATVQSVVGRSLYQSIGIGCVAIVVGMLFGFWIYRSVLPPLRLVLGAVRSQQDQGEEKAQLAKAVASGDLNREVTISQAISLDAAQLAKDEMGMVLSAVLGMSEAQTTLDRALADMTTSLRSGRDEEQRRDRLKNGLHELNRILREESDLTGLLEYSLAFIVAFLDAGVGIIYLYREREELLEPVASYAISLADRPDHGMLKAGEGLAGQVAANRKTIHLAEVPEGYLPITSALGEADPLQVAILPIMHNGVLAGVLELGSFKPFDADSFAFLEQALEGMAIAITTSRSRQLVNELLEQTQSQAEELRVQQEELQQRNEELAERAHILEEKVKFR